MKAVRIATAALAMGLALSAFVLAQTAPAPDIALPAGETIRGKADAVISFITSYIFRRGAGDRDCSRTRFR